MHRTMTWFSCLFSCLLSAQTFGDETMRVYFGTYTDRSDSAGIYVGDFDPLSGQIKNVRVAGETDNPTFLEMHPDGETVLSVGQPRGGGKHLGEPSVVSWRIDAGSGALAMKSRAPSRGSGPCHVSVSPDGRFVGVANYGSGSVAVYQIDATGTLSEALDVVQHSGHGVDASRQTGPHAHSVQFAPGGRFVLAADLGTDEIRVYDFDGNRLVPHDPAAARLPAGAGPRHFAFSPSGDFVFVINELDGTMTSFRWKEGTLSAIETVELLPGGWRPGYSAAEVLVHPNGRFVYGSVRGHDSIVVFRWDETSARLIRRGDVPSGGQTPRNFRISPDGNWLLAANRDSDSVVVFRLDSTGMPQQTNEMARIPKPVCIRFQLENGRRP
jgi:6-phosphogluconolactonase